MPEIRVEVEQVLRYIGMNGTKKGFWCLYWGVVLAMEDPSMLSAVTKRLYPAVAEAYDNGLMETVNTDAMVEVVKAVENI